MDGIRAIVSAACLLLAGAANAATILHDEAVSGDLAAWGSDLLRFDLDFGVNSVIGTITASKTDGDADAFLFSRPANAGHVGASVTLMPLPGGSGYLQDVGVFTRVHGSDQATSQSIRFPTLDYPVLLGAMDDEIFIAPGLAIMGPGDRIDIAYRIDLKVDSLPPTPVPAPPAGLLLGSGLAAGALARRVSRRRRPR